MKVVSRGDDREPQKASRDELILIVRKLMNAEGSEKEMDEMISILEESVPHPAPSDLIFWPKQKGSSAEEIVDEALSYKSTCL